MTIIELRQKLLFAMMQNPVITDGRISNNECFQNAQTNAVYKAIATAEFIAEKFGEDFGIESD